MAAVADSLKSLIGSAGQEALPELPEVPGLPRGNEGKRLLVLLVLQAFYEELPHSIKAELARDPDFMATIGLEQRDSITVGDVTFEAGSFWLAAAEAVNGRAAEVTVLEPQVEVTLRPARNSRGLRVCRFAHPLTGEEQVIEDDHLELLLESPTARETAVRRLRPWFDCSIDAFEREVAEIASLEDPRERLARARSWRDASVEVHFRALRRRLSQHAAFKFDELLPASTEGLLRHFRLDCVANVGPAAALQAALADAARSLARDGECAEAVRRLAGLPMPLPQALLDAMDALNAPERRVLIKQLLREEASPVSAIHLIAILLRWSSERPAYIRLARRVVRRLIADEGVQAAEALLTLVRWANDRLGVRPAIRTWPGHLRLALAWVLGHRLYAILTSTGAPVDWLRETFGAGAVRVTPDWIERSPDYWWDVAHPQHLGAVTLLLDGLAYGLGEQAEQVIDDRLRAELAARATMEAGGGRMPFWPLIRDPTQAQDGLGSFLGGDRGERFACLLGRRAAQALSRVALETSVEAAVERLGDPDTWPSAWALLWAVLGDFPPYEKLGGRLRAILPQVAFVDLAGQQLDAGTFALHTASSQAMHLDDEELCRYLADEVVRTAELLGKLTRDDARLSEMGRDGYSEQERVHFRLLEAALNLAVTTGRPAPDAMSQFADTVARLADTAPLAVPLYRQVVQTLCEELPPSCTRGLWRVLVRLRAG